MFCSKCGSPLLPDARYCARCGTPVVSARRNSAAHNGKNAQPQALPMKWYHFLVRFFLPLNVIVNGIAVGFEFVLRYIAALAGTYSPYTALVCVVNECSADLPRFALGGIVSMAWLIHACYAVVVRERLIGYRTDADRSVTHFFVTDAVIAVSSIAVDCATAGIDCGIWDIIGLAFVVVGIIVLDVLAAVNSKTYFEKRAALFVN